MDLTEKEIKSYNEMFQKRYNRDATEKEIFEIKRDLRMLAEIIYESYIHDKKTGKLPGILKEIESEK
jgi:hypothetical protein